MARLYIGIIIIGLLFLSSCCHYNEKNKTIWGYGKYKDKDVEMECNSPIESLVNLSGINQ